MSSDNPSVRRTSTGAANGEETVKDRATMHNGKNAAFRFVYADALEQHKVREVSQLPPAQCLCCGVAKGT